MPKRHFVYEVFVYLMRFSQDVDEILRPPPVFTCDKRQSFASLATERNKWPCGVTQVKKLILLLNM